MKRNICLQAGLLLIILLSSCKKDYLEREPLTQISNDAYWKTASDLEKYALQFYASFPAFGNVGSYTGLIGWDGTRGSDTQIISVPSTTWNGSRSIVTSGGNWSWTNIQSVNVFFANYRRCIEPLNTYKHYVGEAHFFKAWYYFEKVVAYGDVPWFSNPLNIESDELYKPRDSRTVVVDSILWNLDKAIEYLNPLKAAVGGNNRLSKEAALLFKSRVALFEGSWQKYHKGTDFGTAGVDPNKYFRTSVDAAEELMKAQYTNGIYTTGSPNEDYCRLFSLTDQSANREVLLWKKYDIGLQMGHSFQIYVSDRTAGNMLTLQQVQHYLDKTGAPYDFLNTGKTVKGSKFLTKIGQECDPRLAQTIWTPNAIMWDNGFGKGTFSKPFLDQSGEFLNNTGFQIRKGNDPKDPQAGSGVSWNTNSTTGAIVFRYAEALLNYAEAKSELGEAVDYGKSLNLLRNRVNMPNFSVQPDPFRSTYADYGYAISNELQEIRRERTVELGAEGFRYTDLMRWRAHNLLLNKRPKGYPYDAAEWVGKKINYKTDGNGFLDPYQTQLPNGYGFKVNRDYLESIPTNEITLNPKLAPNPGW
ncbi:RagB/SusD family nutrient uptake outer membrane protein [Pedobacter frigoris]|uniref:RagB/SusD family nutrient uptake outer membrane protein n=1 Tax=Pedobacter frigoris TaxID=2571272 RepID=A0A4U1CMG6_9SPHI|nr:RagB/SusD family nutrient uptake outer membrane protein [Pedobacter frigoris]TKC08583.1 RagB/SusD family nutrient uptake outer membrane protein [Pedobacter frigoris]